MLLTTEPGQEGMTVLALTRRLGISRRNLIRLKKTEGGITVNGSPATVRYVLCAGDVVYFALEDDAAFGAAALPSGETERGGNGERVPYGALGAGYAWIESGGGLPRVLYEDEWLIAFDKPPGMPTHPSHGHRCDSLGSAAARLWRERGKPFVFRPVNRLDRDTSGVVLAAKSQHAACAMSKLLQARAVEKVYTAVLDGSIAPESGEIETYIVRRGDSIIERMAADEGLDSERALTRYRRIAVGGGLSLVDASPVTGRTHQLRVHFAHVGFPVTGDDLYGSPSPHIGRQALHARLLGFTHPFTGREVTVFSPLPDDIRALCAD